MSKTKEEIILASSFEEVCAKEGLDPEKCLPDVSNSPEIDRPAILGQAMMFVVARHLNRNEDGSEWRPDWNSNEDKFEPYFDMRVRKDNPSGFRFSDSDCAWTYTYAYAGSRLCYRDRKTSDYAGKTFESIYRMFMVIPKK